MRQLAGGFLALALIAAPPAGAAGLSPESWPAEERARLEQAELQVLPQATRIVEGSKAIVATTASPIAVRAGMEALRQGGTAADAAVTIAMTQTATVLGSVISYAGIAEILYYEAATGQVHSLDAGWNSYREETDAAAIPSEGEEGRRTLVPGFMAGMEAFHARFGTLEFADLLTPAIWYAENGVRISGLPAAYFAQFGEMFERTPEGRAFARPGGGPLPRIGELYRQPELARTLRGVAQEGAAYMYTGAWGQAYVDAVRRDGGKATLADMAAYEPTWREPLSTSFAGTTVYGPNADNRSACLVLGGLALVDAMGLQDRPPYWTDPASFRTYADIVRYVTLGTLFPTTQQVERDKGFDSSCRARLTPEYAAAMAPHVGELVDVTVLDPAAGSGGSHSSAIVVVDEHGNVASLVHTINTTPWGDTGIVVGGVPVSNAGGMMKAQIARQVPGSRITTTMAPVIVMRDGRPVLAVAAVGSSLVPETIRVTAGLLAGLPPEEVAAAPPWLVTPIPFGPRVEIVPPGTYSAAFLEEVRGAGLTTREEANVGGLRGTAAIGLIGPDGRLRSVEVPRVLGVADAD